jgi:hypothetical protein
MECRGCGNKDKFQVVVTDYKPMEIWEFEGGALKRYCQPDSGDVEMEIACAKCGSDDVDAQGLGLEEASKASLTALSDVAWDQKVG